MTLKRQPTEYPGIFFRMVERPGKPGEQEKMFYAVYKKDGRVKETKVGSQYRDRMTAAKAARVRADLLEGRRQTRQEVREKAAAAADRWTVDRLWQEYKAVRKPKGLYADEQRFIDYVQKPFGSKTIDEIFSLDVRRFRKKLEDSRLKPATVWHALEIIRRVTNFGWKHQLSPRLSFKIEMPKFQNEVTEVLTSEQLQDFFKALDSDADQHVANMLRLCYLADIRRGDLLKLKWQDIDFEKGTILLKDPKGGRPETIIMSDAVRQVLLNQEKIKYQSEYVFASRRTLGKRNDFRKAADRIYSIAGIDRKRFRPTTGLRHTNATLFAQAEGVSEFELDQFTRHRSKAAQRRYLNPTPEFRKSVAEKAAKILMGGQGNE